MSVERKRRSLRRLVSWLTPILDASLLRVPRFFGLLYGPIDDSLPLAAAWRRALRRRLPSRVGWWYALGGATYFFLMLLVVSGVLLSIYYRPSVAEAYQSLQYIETQVSLGWVVRNVHYWAANLVVFLALLHLLRVVVTAAYKSPRETNWLIGIFLLGTVMAFGLTGYLLPWDQWAYWTTSFQLDSLARIPVVGSPLARLLRVDDYVSGATLSRYFALHVILLPWVALLFLILHFTLIRKHGVGPPEARQERTGEPFYPDHMLRQLAVVLVSIGVVVTLAILRPRTFSGPADPFQPPAEVQVVWFPMAVLRTVTHYLGGWGITAFFLLFLFLFLVPILDRSPERHPRQRPVALTFAALLVALLLGLWIHGGSLREPLVESRQPRVVPEMVPDTGGGPPAEEEQVMPAAPGVPGGPAGGRVQ